MPALAQSVAPEKLLRGDVLSWSDGNPVVHGLDVEAFGQFVGAEEAEASAHGEAV